VPPSHPPARWPVTNPTQAEELLHAATTGSEAAKSKILALVAEVQAQGTAAREAAAALNPPPPPPRRQRPAAYPGAPDTISVRPRPSAEIKSDMRRLPVLIGANGFPFIRVKKPQPEYLNRVLRDKIERKSVRHERIIEWSGEQMDLAIAEQEWDERLGLSQHGEGNWQKVLVQEAQRVGAQMQNESAKTGELGRRMTEVVDRERAVWEQERMAEKREKGRVRRREWRRKRREEKEAAEGLKDQLSG